MHEANEWQTERDERKIEYCKRIYCCYLYYVWQHIEQIEKWGEYCRLSVYSMLVYTRKPLHARYTYEVNARGVQDENSGDCHLVGFSCAHGSGFVFKKTTTHRTTYSSNHTK